MSSEPKLTVRTTTSKDNWSVNFKTIAATHDAVYGLMDGHVYQWSRSRKKWLPLPMTAEGERPRLTLNGNEAAKAALFGGQSEG